MLKTYNKGNNTYSRYFHVSEIEAALEKMKQISSRVEYRPFFTSYIIETNENGRIEEQMKEQYYWEILLSWDLLET